jgi:hypothetical protein
MVIIRHLFASICARVSVDHQIWISDRILLQLRGRRTYPKPPGYAAIIDVGHVIKLLYAVSSANTRHHNRTTATRLVFTSRNRGRQTHRASTATATSLLTHQFHLQATVLSTAQIVQSQWTTANGCKELCIMYGRPQQPHRHPV